MAVFDARAYGTVAASSQLFNADDYKRMMVIRLKVLKVLHTHTNNLETHISVVSLLEPNQVLQLWVTELCVGHFGSGMGCIVH